MKNSYPVLQEALVELIDLGLIAKQAHWNVKGPNFRSVHLQLDEINDELHTAQDDVAERLAAIGGEPDGTSQTVAKTTTVKPLPTNGVIQCEAVVKAFSDSLAALSQSLIEKIDKLEGDQASQDLLGAIVAGVDKAQWMFRSQTE